MIRLLGLRARLAGTIDAFLLKIVIEQELGFPTELVQDVPSPEIYEALASGVVHMYPEVAQESCSFWAAALGPF